MSEDELIKKAQEGDKRSLAELVKQNEQTVYNFAFKICRNKDRAENAMQETFMSMVKSIGQFSGKSKLSTWLYRVVSNHCLMMARSRKRHEHFSINDDDSIIEEKYFADWRFTPEKVTENEELKVKLDNAIKKLPPDYRVVFLLRDIEGLSTEETGETLDLSVPAVKSRLHRARAFLRDELNKVFENGSQ
ncbi:MAG: sigma-70 family RNA polymerase sigma factor [Melioribacteraceae bacterium]|nr:sigma-70 family RNA polymerase sigma factor [Melioribacteraceae bacterium]MCF8263662.1 sigma-70 family RNA polymerase sigma factor [Melioribacteraceae bacterium]MCF8412601.1 sigma-70 family RNA polymerase sigma factor [Melioribacteraceae bacterium]MCF8431398.1 sigma-70 family RNA polymerase sigma factor [Melioribacteraceae bacterium]